MRRAPSHLCAILLICSCELFAGDNRDLLHQRLSTIQETLNRLPPSPEQSNSPGVPDSVPDGPDHSFQFVLKHFHSANPREPDIQSQNLVIGWSDPYEEITISGDYSLDGNIVILNHGILNLMDANFTLRGNIVIADSGLFHVRGGNLTVLAEYLYHYSIMGVGSSTTMFDTTEISINGQNWGASFIENSHLFISDTHFNDGITVSVSGSAQVDIVQSNPFEWVLFDSATVTVSGGGPHIFWFVFPDSSQADLSFPDGEFVTDFSLSAEDEEISGVGYTFEMDSTSDVYWGLILQDGSDVTVRDSYLRTTGIMAVKSDSLEISGLVNHQHYDDFTAPISDRTFHLVNTTLETWNVYSWGVQNLSLNHSMIGELGTAKKTETVVAYSMVDGSGGYVFTGDRSFTIFFFSTVFSHIISGGRSLQMHFFASTLIGDIIATDASMMVFVNSLTEQIPVARDTSVIVEMAINSPEKPSVDRLVPITGTAVISGGPFFPVDLESYRLDYGMGEEPDKWIQIGAVHTHEVRDNILEIWDTHGLQPGPYVLRLTLFVTAEDSLEARRWVYLGESPEDSLRADDTQDVNIPDRILLSQNYPNPFNPKTAIDYQINKSSLVSLCIYDPLGRKVRTLVNGNRTAGKYSILWDGRDEIGQALASGIYLYTLRVDGSFKIGRKMLLLR